MAATFREYSVAQAYEATVHPRWAELKARANQALKDGDLDGAIEGYACALSITDASNVAALFDVLSAWPADSAGAKLAAACVSNVEINPRSRLVRAARSIISSMISITSMSTY